MAITVTKQPTKLQSAYNPVVFRFSSNNDSDLSINWTLNCWNGKSNTISGKSYFYNRECVLDISNILKKLFNDYIYEDAEWWFCTKLQWVEYNLTATGMGLNYHFVGRVTRGAFQIGKKTSLLGFRGNFLSEFKTLKKYEGYPLETSFLSFPVENFMTIDDGDEYEYLGLANDYNYSMIFNLRVLNDWRNIMIGNKREDPHLPPTGARVEKSIEHVCTPKNPFYVRWINQRGGYEYWMFQHSQIRTSELKNIETYRNVIFDNATAERTETIFAMDAAETITVGAEGLIKSDFEVVRKILYSPDIRYFDTNLQKWIVIYLEKGKVERNNIISAKDLEFNFILPKPILQI